MKQLMLLYAMRKHFPVGHQWQSTQMRRVHLLGFAFPECTSSSRPRSDSSPWDTALMCMHLCHIIQALLQLTPTWHLNSPTNQLVMPWRHYRHSSCIFRSSYSGKTARLMQTGLITVVWHRSALVHVKDGPPRLFPVHQHRSRLCQLIWWM